MTSVLSRLMIFRYLKGKRKANAVPILSRISIVAIGVAACAMIVLFSVFNGLGDLVKERYKAFYPDVRIVAEKGKFFSFTKERTKQLSAISSIKQIAFTIEDNVLMNNQGQDNQVVSIKGVTSDFFAVNDFKPYVTEGKASVTTAGEPGAVVGSLIMAQMGMSVNEGLNTITVYYPNVNNSNPSLNPTAAFKSLYLKPVGEFSVMDEFDQKYILASLPLVQELLQAEGKYSAIEIKLKDGVDPADAAKELSDIFGPGFKVETRYEQNQTMYMVINAEKWAMYAILVLVVIIASFNMVGALSLLVLEKQKDIAILKAMGAEGSTIRNIFLGEGMLWSLTGAVSGVILGLLICLGQQQFGWIKMSGFIIDAYPVDIVLTDIPVVLATIAAVGLMASWYPAMKAVRTEVSGLKS